MRTMSHSGQTENLKWSLRGKLLGLHYAKKSLVFDIFSYLGFFFQPVLWLFRCQRIISEKVHHCCDDPNV